jgi:hypothetical protein
MLDPSSSFSTASLANMTEHAESSCPACGHSKVVPGKIEPHDIDAPYPKSYYPFGPKYWYGAPGSKLRDGQIFNCCLSCGLVWSYTDQYKIISILEKLGVPKGEVPQKASYGAHVIKWLIFLLSSLGVAIWLYSLGP